MMPVYNPDVVTTNFSNTLCCDYCQSDVRLLKQGCMKFQTQFKDICGFNPMEHCITIASACNVAFRKNWMPENKIAVQPVRGWRPYHIKSYAALTWLYYEEKKNDQNEPPASNCSCKKQR